MATQDNAPQVTQLNVITNLSSTLVAATSPTAFPAVALPAGNTICKIKIPVEPFAAGNLTFNESDDNVNFSPIYGVDGNPYTIVVGALTAGRSYPIDPTIFYGTRYVQAVSTVSQSNGTVINFTVKPV